MSKNTPSRLIGALIHDFQAQVDRHPAPVFPAALFPARGERATGGKPGIPLLTKLAYAALLALVVAAGLFGSEHRSPADERYAAVVEGLELERLLPAWMERLDRYMGEDHF